MKRNHARALLAIVLFFPSIAAAEEPAEICVERVSVVEDSFITVFEASKSASTVQGESSDGPKIEYSNESAASDDGLVEYGDTRSAAPGLDVVRGDEASIESAGELDVVRGDDDADAQGIDVFRGDETRSNQQARPSFDELGLFSPMRGDPELAQLASLQPTREGFDFSFDGLTLDVMGTPIPRSMEEAFAGLARQPEGPARIRIDTADEGCTKARLFARRGLLELESKSGHWLQMEFAKPGKITDTNLPEGVRLFEFRSKLSLKLRRGQKTSKK